MNVLMVYLVALLDTLWQAIALVALAWLALKLTRPINSATRFVIWWAVLGCVLTLPVAPRLVGTPVGALVGRLRARHEPASLRATRPRYVRAAVASALETPPVVTIEPAREKAWLRWLAGVWGLLFVCRLAQLLRAYAYLRAVKRQASLSNGGLPRVKRPARLLLSREIDSPIAVGFTRPAVILPDSLPAQLSHEEMDHALLHETAHLARWDDWTNLFGRVLGAMFAAHPIVLWILHRIEIEREAACDDWVVSQTASAGRYARTLARLYELRFARTRQARLLAVGIFGGGSALARRIETLFQQSRDFAPLLARGPVTAAIVALLALGALASLSPHWIAYAQAPGPSFDVASIKRNTVDGDTGVIFAERPGGLLVVVNNPIFNVIDNAFGIAYYQLIGAPEWVSSERYDIEARGPANSRAKDMMLMVQTLLATRFAMKYHFDTREGPAYILTVAKGGPKLHLTGSENCIPRDGTKPNPQDVSNLCGNNLTSRDGKWQATHISMNGVAGILSRQLRGPVIDQTGIKGTFDVNVQWANDVTSDRPDDPLPSMATVLRETLGLEVKSGRGPVRVFVIDHIERPTGN